MDHVNDFFHKHTKLDEHPGSGIVYKQNMPRMKLADGTSLSVQASETHYCTPRINTAHAYTAVEVGYPSVEFEALIPYAEEPENLTETVYGWVPVDIVNRIIEAAGGIIEEPEAT